MTDMVIFGIVFVAFFILRAIAATAFFFYMMPESDRCPLCDSVTLRVESRAWNRLLPWFRTSWCYECGWEGLLRPARTPSTDANTASHSGQLPLSSKKSS
jgi:hypothetical protein